MMQWFKALTEARGCLALYNINSFLTLKLFVFKLLLMNDIT